MSDRFKDKSGKIVVIDTSGPVRQLLSETMRSHGYDNVQGVATIRDALSVLEVESIDWIITPTFTEQTLNAMQLLALITENHDLRHTRISLLADEGEAELLPYAYERGLLCHFEKPFNKASLTKAVADFMAALQHYQWDMTKVAASYLRAHLRACKMSDAQLVLEKNMLNLFPGEVEYLLEMARPLFEAGHVEQAKSALYQAQILSREAIAKADAIAAEIFGEGKVDLQKEARLSVEANVVNILGIKNCVIIDPDASSRRSICNVLKTLGVLKVIEFEDGDSAWEWFHENSDPSLVIHEWRIPKLTGPLLVQRIRKKCPCVPIVIVSSLITGEDLPLVREMGVTCVVEKPIDGSELTKNILHVIQQDKLPTEAESLEIKIRQLIEAGQVTDAIKLNSHYRQLGNIPEVRKKKIMAEFAYLDGDFATARDLTAEAIRGQFDSITMLNFLGKCFSKLRDFESALKCFEKAQSLSPMNVERLCAIAEVNSEMGNLAAADSALAKANKLDGRREDLFEAEAAIRITQGRTQEAKHLLTKLQSLSNVVSLMNNKAVAIARRGDYEEGVALYGKTLESIPNDHRETLAIVSYNLALAHARHERLVEAKAQLEKVLDYGDSKVKEKSKSLLKRVGVALRTKKILDLVEEGRGQEAANKASAELQDERASAHKAILASVDANPGDICCFRIFIHPVTAPEKIIKMLASLPHFVRRDTIARDSSDGFEKTNTTPSRRLPA